MFFCHNYFKGLSTTGFHKLHYAEWGDANNPNVLLCLHGLSRNGRDFDYLAQFLAAEYRVICPDMAGRGASDWLFDAKTYNYPQYLSDITALLARINQDRIDWLGTSMGGILGMILAAQPGTPIKRLILNDVGAFIPKESLKRIVQYVSQSPTFASLEQATLYLKQILASFGITDENHWDHIVHYSIKEITPQQFCLSYDPKIIANLAPEDVNLWAYWQQINCPTLIIRGKESDLLPLAIAHKMLEKEDTTLVEIEGAGHAPSLMTTAQITTIHKWLKMTDVP